MQLGPSFQEVGGYHIPYAQEKIQTQEDLNMTNIYWTWTQIQKIKQ